MTHTMQTQQSNNLDQFYSAVISDEPSQRLECFPALASYLNDQNNLLECKNTHEFITGLIKWVESSNHKIVCNGLRVLEMFAERLDNEFECYVPAVVPYAIFIVVQGCIHNLGDSKCQRIWDLLRPSLEHRIFRVKVEGQRLLIRTLDIFGESTVQLNKILPLISKLLNDSNRQVQQQTIDTLTEIYRRFGEKVWTYISKDNITETRLKILYEKFNDGAMSKTMLEKEDRQLKDLELALAEGDITQKYFENRRTTLLESYAQHLQIDEKQIVD
ncbi:unnamed protein product, partial [Didymodactylos carnosus]